MVPQLSLFLSRKVGHGIKCRVFFLYRSVDSRLPVPRETGYKLCSSCNFFVAETNVHCAKCGVCSSKVILMHLKGVFGNFTKFEDKLYIGNWDHGQGI